MYKLTKSTVGLTVIIRQNSNGSTTSFFEDPANTDYQAYLAWLAEGNEPEPADEPTQT